MDILRRKYLPLFIGVITICFLAIVSITSCVHEPFEAKIPLENDSSDVIPIDTIIVDTTNTVDTSGVFVPRDVCDPDSIYFERDVLPVLSGNCSMSGCHDESTAAEGVILTSFEKVISTGGIEIGNPSASKLYKSIIDTDPGDRMPRDLSALSSADIGAIKKWIAQGALNITCTDSSDSTGVIPSFATQVNPIIQANCAVTGCHVSGAQSPVLEDYTQVSAQADRVKARTVAETMPPIGSASLTQAEIDIIAAWVDGGHPNN